MTLPLSQDQVCAVTEYAAGHRVTLESILLAAWVALLHRHTGHRKSSSLISAMAAVNRSPQRLAPFAAIASALYF